MIYAVLSGGKLRFEHKDGALLQKGDDIRLEPHESLVEIENSSTLAEHLTGYDYQPIKSTKPFEFLDDEIDFLQHGEGDSASVHTILGALVNWVGPRYVLQVLETIVRDK